jgi:hypothetical protein
MIFHLCFTQFRFKGSCRADNTAFSISGGVFFPLGLMCLRSLTRNQMNLILEILREIIHRLTCALSLIEMLPSLGAPLAMDSSMLNGPPASHNINHTHSVLQDSVAAQQKLLD